MIEERIYPEVKQIQTTEEYPVVSEVLISYFTRVQKTCEKQSEISVIWIVGSAVGYLLCRFCTESLIKYIPAGILSFMGVFLILLCSGAIGQAANYSNIRRNLETIVNNLIEMKDSISVFWNSEEAIAGVNMLIGIFNEAMDLQAEKKNPDIIIANRHVRIFDAISESQREQKIYAAVQTSHSSESGKEERKGE